MNGGAHPRYGRMAALAAVKLHSDDGLTCHDIHAEFGGPMLYAYNAMSRLRAENPTKFVAWARHSHEKHKHWFASRALADAYAARDPIARVVVTRGNVRVALRNRAIDLPPLIAKRVAAEILEKTR